MFKSHYDTLGISKEADLEEVKKAFRVLSMQTHPDVASDKSQEGRFKQISEAYRVLSNKRERKLYDYEVEQATLFGGLRRAPKDAGFGPDGRPWAKPPATQGFWDIFFRPRNLLIGATFGVFGGFLFRSFFRDERRHINLQGASKVEAWKNPKSGQWELPAPWDAEYKRLKPTLHFVPREKVQQRR
mmetsp:Transcript_16423/g.24217  ORF Transcript_16423/g.24217 Transcript_16423/m.24217 type:complete len:186 (-) Transcript_16423:1641-2198(-)